MAKRKKAKKKKKAKKQNIGILNGNVPSEFYKHNPCLVGYVYVRLQVDGSALPCCITTMTMGSLEDKPFEKIWFSDRYSAFREKTGNIHKERFHLSEPDWSFCQQCPHLEYNRITAEFDGMDPNKKKTKK